MIILFPSSTERVGVAIHVLNLSKLLHEQKRLSYVLCPKEGWLTDQCKSKNIPYKILHLSYKPSKLLISSWRLFRELFTVKNKTILHLHGRFPLFVSILSMFLNRNIAYFATIHQFSNVGNNGLFDWKERLETFLLNYLTRIGSVSKELSLEIQKKIASQSTQNIFTVPNFIEKYDYSTISHESADQQIKIISIGRLSIEKGFDILIQAVDYLIHTGTTNIICAIYGEGPEKEYLSQLINVKALNMYVSLKGGINNDDLRYSLQNYTMMIIPSRSESFGLVALEAFNAKLPVIASNISGLNEVVINNETGLLFDSEQPILLADKIRLMMSKDTPKAQLTRNAFEWFAEYTDRTRILSEYAKFYAIGAKKDD